MSIDIHTEQLLTLKAATQLPCLIRRGDRPVNASTLWRWATSGARGVRLETVMMGGTRMTSVEAIERFFQTLTDNANDRPLYEPPLFGPKRQRTIKRRGRSEAAAVAGGQP